MHLPSTFMYARYARAKISVHAFMIELDQLYYILISKKKKKSEILYTKSMESCSLVISQILT